MGFLHQKIYAISLLPLFVSENQRFNVIIATYNERRLDLNSFGVRLSGHIDFPRAVALIKQLSGATDDVSSPLLPEAVRRLTDISGTAESYATIANLLDARTPFDCITLIRQAIDELVNQVAEEGQPDVKSTTTDELIPLLAYTIVAAGALDLESMLFYIHNFTQNSLGPEFE